MTTVIIRNNPIDPSEDKVIENVDGVLKCLYQEFDSWPSTAKVYNDRVSDDTEMPLETIEDLQQLNDIEGVVYVVVYPALMAVVGIALIAATAAIMFSAPKQKSTSAAKNDQREIPETSPNNSLSDRSNRERINSRIPDIYGTVRAVPDLISLSYKVYKGNVEVEHAYMVLGRGKYLIEDIREDKTLISQIAGCSLAVYGPYTSPNNSEPELQIGGDITEPLLYTTRSSAVANDVLLAPNQNTFIHDGLPYTLGGEDQFVDDTDSSEWNVIRVPDGFDHDFDSYFAPGDKIEITAGFLMVTTISGGNQLLNLNSYGNPYTVDRVEGNKLFLVNPGSVSSAWNLWRNLYKIRWRPSGDNTGRTYANNTVFNFHNVTKESGGKYILEDAKQVIVNVSCEGGLWKDDGEEQTPLAVELHLTVQQVTESDVPFGPLVTRSIVLRGSSQDRDKVALTYRYNTPWPAGRLQVGLRRITHTIENTNELRTNEEIRWDDLYGAKVITDAHFGDVTTIRTVTKATNSASQVKQRKLNCRASRLIPKRLPDGTFTEPTVTSRFADIMTAVSLDPLIGNRTLDELDLDSFYNTQAEVEAHFGTPIAGEFNHTFDDDNFSYEETLNIITECVHSKVYRQGSIIKTSFEKPTENSLILFNHRNKLPNSETRTVSFGRLNDKDGVELEYIDPADGALVKYYIPENRTAVNPESMRQYGVQHKLQAYFLAKRIWNRIQYQNTITEFEATQEAAMLVLGDRVLVADNTRSKTFDGEIVAQDGSVLTLSQPFDFEAGKNYTIFVQNRDASVQAIAIEPGETRYQVVLQQSTNFPLAVDLDLYARATYEIVENSSVRKRAFLIDEKTPRDNFTTTVKAINYDSRYYQNDKDFINGVINANGNPT